MLTLESQTCSLGRAFTTWIGQKEGEPRQIVAVTALDEKGDVADETRRVAIYHDSLLNALWSAAEYEWRMGQRCGNGEPGEVDLRQQQEYFGRAAQRYETYATSACSSRFDSKASFGAHGEYGERVGMSERALRRCVVLLGAMGKTDRINQVWSDYLSKMRSVSDGRWQPGRETQADMQAAQAQTSAYRFAAQISQMSDFAGRQDRVS